MTAGDGVYTDRMQTADPRFNPAPNRSPSSSLDRSLGVVVAVGVAAVGLALLIGAAAIWIRLMIAVAAGVGPGLGGVLAFCVLLAMGGLGLVALGGLVWAGLQVAAIRRWLHLA